MNRVIRMVSIACALSGVMVLFATPLTAQVPYARPTEGVLLPSPVTTEVNDATAVSTNPSNIGFLDAWNLVYTGAWVADQHHQAGQGQAVFFAIPIGPVGIGVGTEIMLPPDDVNAWQGLDRRVRFSLAMSFNPIRALGLGITWRTFPGYDLGDNIHTFDMSLTVRPINHASLSFSFNDINSPWITYSSVEDDGVIVPSRTEEAPNRFGVALTIRPLGNDRFSLGGELTYMNGTRQVFNSEENTFSTDSFQRSDIQANLSIMFTDGISLRTRFITEGVRSADMATSYYFDTALVIDSVRFPFGIAASPYFKLSPDKEAGFEGMSAMLQFSGDDPPSIPMLAAPAFVVPIRLDQAMNTYEMADLQRKFERILADKSVDMVLLEPGPDSLDLSSARDIRRRIADLRREGIATTCYLKEATTATYTACAGADHVWMHPAGGIRMAGISTRAIYFKSLLDKLGVSADIVRMGEYKSAPEMFTENAPTEPSAEAMNRFMDGTYNAVLSGIAEDRGFSDSAAARNVVESGPFLASEALDKGLIDKLVTTDQLRKEIENTTGQTVLMADRYDRNPLRHRTYIDAPAVAVVHVEGDLVDGESIDIPFLKIRTSGAVTIIKELRQLAENPSIRAVVIRVNSPGGSALASDIIWSEIMALRKVKPVVASLGAVAASGGYYIASAADIIYAEPTTLTGSIGVFYGKADISGLLTKVGISTTTFKRGEHADVESWTRGYSDDERVKLTQQIESYYNLFLDRVAEGRGNGFTRKIVDKRGRGRIWSGTDAKQQLLVDQIGGYLEALNHARALGFVSTGTKVFHFPKPQKNLLMRMMQMGGMNRAATVSDMLLLPAEMRETLRAAMPFALADSRAPMARLPFVISDTP